MLLFIIDPHGNIGYMYATQKSESTGIFEAAYKGVVRDLGCP